MYLFVFIEKLFEFIENLNYFKIFLLNLLFMYFMMFALLFFWSEKNTETTKIFSSTAPPTNNVKDNYNIQDNHDDNKFQSSNEFSKQNYETFSPIFSERYNSFTEEPTKSEDEQEFYEPAPHQYFFSPTEEFIPTESYYKDEL